MNRTRFALAVLLTIVAGLFFGRDVYAAALVGRSDQLFYGGNAAGAQVYAHRALIFDPTYPAAAERLALYALRSNDPSALREATTIAERSLKRSPGDAMLREQYSMLLFKQQRYLDAALSWKKLALQDPTVPLYRAWAAEAAGHANSCRLELHFYEDMLAANSDDKRSARIVANLREREKRGACQ